MCLTARRPANSGLKAGHLLNLLSKLECVTGGLASNLLFVVVCCVSLEQFPAELVVVFFVGLNDIPVERSGLMIAASLTEIDKTLIPDHRDRLPGELPRCNPGSGALKLSQVFK